MTVTIWIQEYELEKFKKFYDLVNNSKVIEKEQIPTIKFLNVAPQNTDSYLQVNVLYDIYYIMKEMMEEKAKTATE
ncbi:MAG: hypothetical protein WC979_01920 [Candidatus Pacearchaeota archaeon]|jgi:hypothetical protein|nr:hypothetical protein [Clostridia bacterium]